MCFQYKCVDCNQSKYKYCEEFDDNTKKCGATVQERRPKEEQQKCRTCVTIKGAINSLRHLVFREPWLETEGLSGAPKKESWEMDNAEEDKDYDSGGEDEDGYTQEKRKTVREEAERAVVRRWRLMKQEQEQEQEAHKGKSTSGSEC